MLHPDRVLVLVMLLAAACTGREPRTAPGPTGFPAGPAACAGPHRDEAYVRRQWAGAKQHVESDPPFAFLRFGLSKALTPEEALTVTGTDLALAGVSVGYGNDEGQNFNATGISFDTRMDAEELRRQLEKHLLKVGELAAPFRDRIEAGDFPIVELRVKGPMEAMERFANENQCLLYSVLLGVNTSDGPIVGPDAVAAPKDRT